MFHLTQYIIVRRDIPMENLIVYAAHAAGKASFAQASQLIHACQQGNVLLDKATWEKFDPDWGFPSRIVRGIRSEAKLRKLHEKLTKENVTHSVVIEPDDGPFKGQMMALATMFGHQATLGPFLNEVQNLRMKDVPDFLARGGRAE